MYMKRSECKEVLAVLLYGDSLSVHILDENCF